ncbi:gtp pyrophosphokinase [Nannochloropsis oceanica]
MTSITTRIKIPRAAGREVGIRRLLLLFHASFLCLFLSLSTVGAFAPLGLCSHRRRIAVTVGSSPSSTTPEAAAPDSVVQPTISWDMRVPRRAGLAPPTHSSSRDTRLVKGPRRVPQPTNYGLWDLLIGPVAADFKLVGMPSELGPLANDVHRATEHLTRPERLAVLQALVRSYHAYRLRAPSPFVSQEATAAHSPTEKAKAKSLTVGAYMEQNVAVIRLLGDSEVDGDTMVAALLCQAPLSVEAVEADFGAPVAGILKGWKAMLAVESQLEIKSLIHEYAHFLWGGQGDNLRNLLLVVGKDWRAVALRVAWKKVEMETRVFGTKKDEIDACWACLNVYASLAEAAGMSIIKNALEDRAFQFLMPQEHRRVVSELEARRGHYQKVLGQARREVLQALMEDPIFMSNVERVEVRGRIKSPYSTWKKMKRKGQREGASAGEGGRAVGFEGLYDMVALRVVCTPLYNEEKKDVYSHPSSSSSPSSSSPPTPLMLEARASKDRATCEYILHEVVHKLRPHYKSRVKDYIGEGKRKANGYQSLHTTLAYRIRGETTPVEVQIRTSEMHSVAEHGLAAHCLYKGDKNLADVIERGQQQMDAEMGEQGKEEQQPPRGFAGPGEFLTWCQRMLDKSHVIVFSPDGRLLKLDRGATLLDFLKASYVQRKVGRGMVTRSSSISSSVEHGVRNGEEKHHHHKLQPQRFREEQMEEAAEERRRKKAYVQLKKTKRSTQGMLLLNGRTAPALDQVLVTGDVISYM